VSAAAGAERPMNDVAQRLGAVDDEQPADPRDSPRSIGLSTVLHDGGILVQPFD
jgi:hypothetical protein